VNRGPTTGVAYAQGASARQRSDSTDLASPYDTGKAGVGSWHTWMTGKRDLHATTGSPREKDRGLRLETSTAWMRWRQAHAPRRSP